jgi:hypothetical protein
MIAFLVELDNRVGSAAEVAETIAERGINVTGGAGLAVGSSGRLAVTTNDEPGTRRALLGRGYKFREIEIVPITLSDNPGSFAKALRALADANINVEAAVPMGSASDRNTIGFCTDDPAKARTTLHQKIGAGTSR